MIKFEIPQKGIIYLQDGTVFEGFAAGKPGTTTGEICFNTAMTGYQETFTDPSYYRQILIMNTAHIGNYGVLSSEMESDNVKISGLICKNFSDKFSRIQADESIQNFLFQSSTLVIYGVDTRALVRHIRRSGSMNAILSTEHFDTKVLAQMMKDIPSMEGLELSSQVTTPKAYEVGNPNASKKVALLDLGVKQNIIRCLTERNVLVKVFPMSTPLSAMEEWKPDGYLISNGPGDPETMNDTKSLIQALLDANKKIFGICLGHQILGRALGMQTFKMSHGHRGINHPVLNIISGKGEITSQNHGFAVKNENIPDHVIVSHTHLNDGSIAGLKLKDKDVFSVQYHPEAFAGPHDSRYLFDDFVAAL